MSDWRIINSDVLDGLRSLPDASVHCVVTSPPYFGLRSYGTEQWEGGSADCDHLNHPGAATGNKGALTVTPMRGDVCARCGARRIDRQLGLEATPDEYIERMVAVFAEVWRVLRPDGTAWVNMGDSYASSTDASYGGLGASSVFRKPGRSHSLAKIALDGGGRAARGNYKPKDLMMMPARLALALQGDGWWLRSDIIWCKRAPMPESVTDRPTSAHEHIFLLSKAEKYFYDAQAVREANTINPNWDYGSEKYRRNITQDEYKIDGDNRNRKPYPKGWSGLAPAGPNGAGRNLWNYWLLSPEPYAAAHFATFPTEIPRRAILAGTSERGCCSECGAPWRRVVERTFVPQPNVSAANGIRGVLSQKPMDASNGWQGVPRGSTHSDTTGWQPTCRHTDAPLVPATVLDPFSGAGTTLLVAQRLGRRSIGIELNAEYIQMAEKRIQSDPAAMNMRMELVEEPA